MDKELEDVRAFHKKFGILEFNRPGHLTQRKLKERLECMMEELEEFAAACGNQDLAGQTDALIDLVYFAKGTACMLGIPWEELWKDVQRANMEKVRGIGHRGHQVDMVKPEGWQGPKTIEILARAGYDIKTLRKENQRDDNCFKTK
jgi:predicted HAD superfamily Cof-like phosphohydrolase